MFSYCGVRARSRHYVDLLVPPSPLPPSLSALSLSLSRDRCGPVFPFRRPTLSCRVAFVPGISRRLLPSVVIRNELKKSELEDPHAMDENSKGATKREREREPSPRLASCFVICMLPSYVLTFSFLSSFFGFADAALIRRGSRRPCGATLTPLGTTWVVHLARALSLFRESASRVS